jgi:hypothetical protein
VPFKLEVNYPEFPKGEEFDVAGVLVKNGGSTELDADAEAAFVSRHGKSVKEAIGANAHIKVSGSSALGKKSDEGGDN